VSVAVPLVTVGAFLTGSWPIPVGTVPMPNSGERVPCALVCERGALAGTSDHALQRIPHVVADERNQTIERPFFAAGEPPDLGFAAMGDGTPCAVTLLHHLEDVGHGGVSPFDEGGSVKRHLVRDLGFACRA
jgi:hypothetical protein